MTVVLLIKTESLVVEGRLWGLDNDMEWVHIYILQIGASHLVFSNCLNLLINFRIYCFIVSINIWMNMNTLHTLICINSESQLRKHKKCSLLSPSLLSDQVWNIWLCFYVCFLLVYVGFFIQFLSSFVLHFNFFIFWDVFWYVFVCFHTSVAKFQLVLGNVTFFQFLCSSLCVYFFMCPPWNLQWVLWL
jgi:hypothetical protein